MCGEILPMKHTWPETAALLAVAIVVLAAASSGTSATASVTGVTGLSPTALAATPDGGTLYVACAAAGQVAVFDTVAKQVSSSIPLPAPPSGLTLSRDGSRLYATCATASSPVCVIDTEQRRVIGIIKAGHTAMAPVISPDDLTLYVCNRFNNDVSVIDLASGCALRRIPVQREPVAAAITPDGKLLLVANHLHAGPANDLHATAVVTAIDTSTGSVAQHINLTLGAGLLKGLAISPDGRFAAVTHLRSMFWLSTTSVELGRINNNALTILDLSHPRVLGTLLLDQAARGAANPWAVAWTPDGKTIAVTHAGTHELSLIDAPVVANPLSFHSLTLGAYAGHLSKISAPPQHPVRVRQRLSLTGQGPRALAMAGSQLFVANYFTDDLSRIDLSADDPSVERWPLGREAKPSLVRRGEMYFNDARLCFQGWQSCASCHDTDGRTDAFNWDLLNDGKGNPKNTKSLVWAHRTGRAMALGVRANAEAAVRAGIHHILFTDQPEEVADAMDAFLKSLEPIASPHLVDGRLSPAARRGERLFMSASTGCAPCHPPGLSTDLEAYHVGTAEPYRGVWGEAGVDDAAAGFETPALVELWRTAPYLHNGSAATLREVFTKKNARDQHGKTSHLSDDELDDLVAYLLSL
jgi:YVTN family beta-propeller protein